VCVFIVIVIEDALWRITAAPYVCRGHLLAESIAWVLDWSWEGLGGCLVGLGRSWGVLGAFSGVLGGSWAGLLKVLGCGRLR
jgi:hypothetical protein